MSRYTRNQLECIVNTGKTEDGEPTSVSHRIHAAEVLIRNNEKEAHDRASAWFSVVGQIALGTWITAIAITLLGRLL